MSSVRMCDNCKQIFSENDSGWSNMTGSEMVWNDKTNRVEPKQISVDYCTDCVIALKGASAHRHSVAAIEQETKFNGGETQGLSKRTE